MIYTKENVNLNKTGKLYLQAFLSSYLKIHELLQAVAYLISQKLTGQCITSINIKCLVFMI